VKPQQGGLLFAWEAEPASALERWSRRLLSALLFGSLFLLPFFGFLAAEPTPYSDPEGAFTITPPDGWSTDDSGHMGPGLVAKGPADAAGNEPLIHLTHEPAGIVTHEVRWQTLLGQLRFDNERLKFLAIKEQEGADPASGQAVYVYQRGGQGYQAVTRLVLARGRFYQMTGVALESEFHELYPALIASFDSLRFGGK
jgi:hypothetical protein